MDRSGKGRGRGGNFLRFSACRVFFYDITFKRLRYFNVIYLLVFLFLPFFILPLLLAVFNGV